jgi:heptosyltransferase-2
MRTLIVAPDTLGEAVMTQPLVSLLKRADPSGAIDVLAPPRVAAVFDAMADVDEVFTSRHAYGPLQPWGKFLLSRRLDRRRHDRAYVLPTARRAALVPWLAGIPVRIGQQCDGRCGLINQPYCAFRAGEGCDIPDRPAIERFARLAFDPSRPPPGRIPDPVLSRDGEREITALVEAGLPADASVLALCVGTDDGPSRRWPARHWASLITTALEAWPEVQAVLLGRRPDRAFATEIAALSGGRAHNLCGRQSLADALAIVARAEAVVAHDCGLMHAAAAFDRPMVAVFGPSDPRCAPPRSPRARVEWLHLECSPCEQPTCRYAHGQCTAGVRPEQVFASLQAVAGRVERDIR